MENPDGSWLWRQSGELSWSQALGEESFSDFRVDYCRFGTQWRKRTKFRTNGSLGGQRLLCTCAKPHLKLRGRCSDKGCSYTKLAEPYPRALCSVLAFATLVDMGKLCGFQKLDIAACAKVLPRVGEASHPGPRRASRARPRQRLADVNLVEPATARLQAQIVRDFLDWFSREFPGASFDAWCCISHGLVVSALVAFGHATYDRGTPLQYYRQLLAYMQRQVLGLKPWMSAAWDTVSRWEVLEPVQHRPPLPEPLVRAMACVGIAWGWKRWTCVLLTSFFAVMRVGELLKARRRDILTPADLLSSEEVIYVKVEDPKIRRRGARIQYSTLAQSEFLPFVVDTWSRLDMDELIYGGSPSAFRSRWDRILAHLGVAKLHRLTPGSLRGGGAVWAHKSGIGISELMWKMRISHLPTLSHYLQEVTCLSVLPALPPGVRERILLLQIALPGLLHTQWPHSAQAQLSPTRGAVGLGS